MKKRIVFTALIIIAISNLPFVSYFLREDYTYANIDDTFTYSEEGGKGKSFEGCQRKYGYFLCQHPEKDQGDNRLFRTFTIKPWRFWQFGDYIFHSERFMLPYKDSESRKPR